ncbi:hypothetical protein [Micromonospora echinospora]|uniref:hypothetical protein n=1 Tax=Micromonospora echinospora TaxID=1877 RepID=UPI003F4DA31C
MRDDRPPRDRSALPGVVVKAREDGGTARGLPAVDEVHRTGWPPGRSYRYSTNLQVTIDVSTRLVIALGEPQPGNRNYTIVHHTSVIDQKFDGWR